MTVVDSNEDLLHSQLLVGRPIPTQQFAHTQLSSLYLSLPSMSLMWSIQLYSLPHSLQAGVQKSQLCMECREPGDEARPNEYVQRCFLRKVCVLLILVSGTCNWGKHTSFVEDYQKIKLFAQRRTKSNRNFVTCQFVPWPHFMSTLGV